MAIIYRMANMDDLKTVTELSILMCEGDHCGWHEDDTIIRIISARKATQLEQKLWKRC